MSEEMSNDMEREILSRVPGLSPLVALRYNNRVLVINTKNLNAIEVYPSKRGWTVGISMMGDSMALEECTEEYALAVVKEISSRMIEIP